MPDWFTDNAPQASAGGDWFSANAPTDRRPVSAEDFAPAAEKPKGSALGRFFSGAAEMLNPLPAIEAVGGAILHPSEIPGDLENLAKGAIGAQVAQGKKALELAKQGRYTEAAGHGAAGLLPLLGPAAAAAGEQIASGDVAGGLGKGAGLLAPMAAGAALPEAVNVPAAAAATDPAALEALALAERFGVPLDAATATGNRFIKAAQHVADRSLAGSFVADKANAAQSAGLATLGEQLASKGFPVPISAEEAGAGIADTIRGKMRGHAAEADDAYNRLRAFAADPKHLDTIEPPVPAVDETAPALFPGVGPGGNTNELFLSALKEARKQGYAGTAADLKGIFDDRVAAARSLRAASTDAEYSPQALLASIREHGGIRPFDKDFQAGSTATKLSGEYENLKQQFGNHRGQPAVFRQDGRPIDDMVDLLRQDPRWKSVVPEDPEQFKEMLASGEFSGVRPSPSDLQHYLRGVGVTPGAKWWEATGEAKQIPLAVDLRSAKEALAPVHAELARQKALTPLISGSQKAGAFDALDRIIKAPDHASLIDVDAALGELKAFARSDEPALRTIGQGKVAGAIKHLDALVRQRAEAAGPEVAQALHEGRQATIAKYGAADVLDQLHAEPVRTMRALTAPGDTAIEKLRAVASQAPEALPAVGRAKLGDLLDMAPDKAAAEWGKLGTATRQMLYKDPGYVRDLDSFFRLRKMMAATPNPSGTAHTLLTAGQGGMLITNPLAGAATQIAAGTVSKLLHSQAGVRLLTRGLRIPVANKAAAGAWLADLAAATSPSGSQSPALAPAR